MVVESRLLFCFLEMSFYLFITRTYPFIILPVFNYITTIHKHAQVDTVRNAHVVKLRGVTRN